MMTDKQRAMAREALGLPNEQNATQRNHYCVGEGGDGWDEWQALVAEGLAVKAIGGPDWSGAFFHLTLEGAKAVLAPEEHVSREVAEKMRDRAEVLSERRVKVTR
jgi:hypothetical protein